MKTSFARKLVSFAGVAAALFALAPASRGQGEGIANQTQMGAMGGGMTDDLQYGLAGGGVERDQADAYQKFVKEQNPAKKIQLGGKFLEKYPKSTLAERVDAGLMNTYHAEGDWKDCYQFADAALALQPDDVDVLTTVGWTIPHVYNPNDANADQELSTAETYAKHAIEVLAKMPKPPGLTEGQFAAAKQKRSFQAHSALGLVYFRRNDYDNSAKELEQSTKGNPNPDPTDLFVLGADLQNLGRYGEASDAFGGCSQLAGPLQNQCKQSADLTKAQAQSRAK